MMRRDMLNRSEKEAISLNHTLGDMDLDPDNEKDVPMILSILLDNSTWRRPVPTNQKSSLTSAIHKLAAYVAATYKEI